VEKKFQVLEKDEKMSGGGKKQIGRWTKYIVPGVL
jgi:hypothetical protein